MNLNDTGARIEQLLEGLHSVADPTIAERADDLVRLLVELYGAGLERIAETLVDEDQEALLHRLADDELVGGLLVLHGLHPVGVEERILAALDKVRPYLGSHAGGVEYLGVDEAGVVRLALQGSCDGCPSSTVTVALAIEKAIEAAAPEVTKVEVDGVTPAPTPASTAVPASGLLQIQPLKPIDPDWTSIGELERLAPGATTTVEGGRILVCRVDGALYAYRNLCGSCRAPLQAAGLAGEVLTCAACGTKFDVRLAGRSLDGAAAHLDPLPLLSSDGDIRLVV